MPNSSRQQTIWLPSGNPDTTAISSADFTALGGQPGQLGMEFEYNSRRYQRVQMDSGATVATAVGLPAANQLAYWKSKGGSAGAGYIVTNDRNQALGFSGGNDGYRNQVAGIIRQSLTTAQVAASTYVDILKAGDNIPVASDGSGASGGVAVAEAGTAARVTAVTAGTAPTCIPVGVIRGAAVANVINVDVDIPDTP